MNDFEKDLKKRLKEREGNMLECFVGGTGCGMSYAACRFAFDLEKEIKDAGEE